MLLFVGSHDKGSVVTGTVTEVDAKGAVINLAEGVDGYLRASELSRDRVEDARTILKEGEAVEAKFMGVDRKNRSISLSIKAKDAEEEAAVIRSYSSDTTAGTSSLGDLLKEQLGGDVAKD
jgi:small subunit ribosomal protein S1